MFDHGRFVHVSIHVDANRVNSRTALPNMNQLEKWRDNEVILMQMSRTAQEEAAAGGSAARSQKARSYIFTLTGNLIDEERGQVDSIERVLFPNGASTPNERNDLNVVFNAGKYGAILVTADGASRRQPGGILGNRAALAGLGVQVMTDDEAVAYIRRKFRERDERAVSRAKRDGTPVPDWVGRD